MIYAAKIRDRKTVIILKFLLINLASGLNYAFEFYLIYIYGGTEGVIFSS